MTGQQRAALVEALADALGVTVIWEGQHAPAPALPYASLTSLGARSDSALAALFAPAEEPQEGAELDAAHVLLREESVRVQVFAAGGADPAGDIAEAGVRRLQLPEQRDTLRAVGVTIGSVGDVAKVWALQAASFDARATFTVALRYVSREISTSAALAVVHVSFEGEQS